MSDDALTLHCAGEKGAHTRSRKRRGGPSQATDSRTGESKCRICNLSCLCERISLSACSAPPAPNITLKNLQILKYLVILNELSLFNCVTWNIVVSSSITYFLLHSYNHIYAVYLWHACVNACLCVCVCVFICMRVCVSVLYIYIYVCLFMRVLHMCFFCANACMFVRGSCVYYSALPTS